MWRQARSAAASSPAPRPTAVIAAARPSLHGHVGGQRDLLRCPPLLLVPRLERLPVAPRVFPGRAEGQQHARLAGTIHQLAALLGTNACRLSLLNVVRLPPPRQRAPAPGGDGE